MISFYNIDKKMESVHFHPIFMNRLFEEKNNSDFMNQYFKDIPIIYMSYQKKGLENLFGPNIYRFVLKQEMNSFIQTDFQRIYLDLEDLLIKVHHKHHIDFINIKDVVYVTYKNRNI